MIGELKDEEPVRLEMGGHLKEEHSGKMISMFKGPEEGPGLTC